VLLLFGLALVFNVSTISAAAVNQTNVSIPATSMEKVCVNVSASNYNTKSSISNSSTAVKKVVNSTSKTINSTMAAGTPVLVNGLTIIQLKDGISRVQAFYKKNGRLPNYITYGTRKIPIATFKANIATQGLKITTTSTRKLNTSSVAALAASLKAGSTTQYSTAVKIFNWVRDNISYSFYYNTKYGAAKTLKYRTGNCCDTANLIVALARSAGIKARYAHGTCKFSSGNWYGHVWAQLYVNGKWYTADATSSRNSLGVVKNWNTATYTLHGIYNALPF
jgi:transglutaminase-like putative cysteine protease